LTINTGIGKHPKHSRMTTTYRSRWTIRARQEKNDDGAPGKDFYRRTMLSGNDCLLLFDQSGLHERAGAAQWRTIFGNGQTRANGKTKKRERLDLARVADQTAGGVASVVAVVMHDSTMTTVLLHNVTKTTSDRHYRLTDFTKLVHDHLGASGRFSRRQQHAITCYDLQVPRSRRSYNNSVYDTARGSNHKPAKYRRGRTLIYRILWLEGGRGTVSNDVSARPRHSPVLIGRRKVQLSHCRLRRWKALSIIWPPGGWIYAGN